MYLYELINGSYKFVATITPNFKNKLVEAGFTHVGKGFYTKDRITYLVASKKI